MQASLKKPGIEAHSRITKLPDLMINKIAAGEVVERPANVVKELVENAIDSGATRIAVTIEDGGKQLIRVTDDGFGMNPQELQLAVTPHATSKIKEEEDLYNIATMGFRGEALASISAVSKLRIISRPADSIEGHEIRVVGVKFESSQSAGCPCGTTVEVRDLFFNVPARRKFLRAKATEVGHINEQFSRLSLAHPEIAFELNNQGRVTQNLPACDHRLERVAKFYGPELASALLHIEREERGLKIDAYVAPPVQSRATNQWQYTFVNQRYIRDRYIQHAIKEAYRGLTEPNRHGVVFLFLSIDPQQVDVNVHPTKIEVRWADSGMIHSQVLSALRETFQQCDLSPALSMDRSRRQVDPAEQDRIRRETADMFKAATPLQPGVEPAKFGGSTASSGLGAHSPSRVPSHDSNSLEDAEKMWKSLYGTSTPQDTQRDPMSGSDPRIQEMGESTDSAMSPGNIPADRMGQYLNENAQNELSPPRAIQMHNLYLVVETEEGITIIDQHALHERVMYEQLRERFTSGPLESQRLLLPESLKVTPAQMALLEEHCELLQKLGIETSSFGEDAIAIQSFPVIMKDTDVVTFMRDLMDKLSDRTSKTDSDIPLNDILSMMACKASIKAGDPLTREEIDALMRQRHLIDKSESCPHGRPTMLRLTKADLNRQFHRT